MPNVLNWHCVSKFHLFNLCLWCVVIHIHSLLSKWIFVRSCLCTCSKQVVIKIIIFPLPFSSQTTNDKLFRRQAGWWWSNYLPVKPFNTFIFFFSFLCFTWHVINCFIIILFIISYDDIWGINFSRYIELVFIGMLFMFSAMLILHCPYASYPRMDIKQHSSCNFWHQ